MESVLTIFYFCIAKQIKLKTRVNFIITKNLFIKVISEYLHIVIVYQLARYFGFLIILKITFYKF